mgnify:CR=1 FL=1
MLQTGQAHSSPSSPQDIDSVNVSIRRGIDPMTLVMLNFSAFRAHYSMGTSRERICSSMLLNDDEFYYIVGLMNGQKFKSAQAKTAL